LRKNAIAAGNVNYESIVEIKGLRVEDSTHWLVGDKDGAIFSDTVIYGRVKRLRIIKIYLTG
jgi:hypothetical protein